MKSLELEYKGMKFKTDTFDAKVVSYHGDDVLCVKFVPDEDYDQIAIKRNTDLVKGKVLVKVKVNNITAKEWLTVGQVRECAGEKEVIFFLGKENKRAFSKISKLI